MFLKKLSLTAFLVGSVATIGLAQKPTPTVDVADKSRKVGKEINVAYKNWITKDVDYIITPEERKAFKQLQTDEERENFIENFWRRRDPNPDTEENEYRDEYYERIAYANEHYASGIPGWKTDRGRIYITFGKPDSVESHPTGGSYDRPSYEGGGSTTTYPFETWFYRHLDDVGDGLEIEFVDPTGSGEYRIARNANEKDALLYVPGAGSTLGEQIGQEDRADRISGNNSQNRSYGREQDSPFRRLEVLTALQRPPQVKYGDLQDNLTSAIIDNNPLEFDMRIDFFRQSDDRVITTFTVQADNKSLTFEDVGTLPTASMNIFGRITAVSGKRSGIFEDSVSTSTTASELAEVKNERKSIYQKAIALTPGTYKVDVIVRDVKSGNRGIRSLGFNVPKYDTDKLKTSTLILASKMYSTTDRDIGGMFIIGTTKVVPNLSGQFKKGQEAGIYMQIYNAGIDQTTLRPAVDVEYVLTKGGKEVLKQKEDWSGLSDSGQRLTISRLIPTANLPVGEYELRIKIKDRVKEGNNPEDAVAKFTIVQ